MLVIQLFLTVAGLLFLAAVSVRRLAKRATATEARSARNSLPVFSPLEGVTVPLSEMPYVARVGGNVGQGIAVRPSNGALFAPFDAAVVAISPTGHAVALRHVGGVEVLIYVGLDTEALRGEHFTPKVDRGQQVSIGELLVEFDHEAIKAAGHDAITGVIVLNGNQYPHVVPLASGWISPGEALFMAIAGRGLR